MKKVGRIILKTVLWIIGTVLALVILIVVLIQVPGIQNFLKNKAVTFLENKIHTKVKIDHFSVGFPKMVVLEGVYFEDQHRDTLIAGDKLKVDISMMKLLHNQVEVNEIDLEGITANVNRDKDSVFNFDYIIKAFASAQKTPPKPQDTTAGMKMSVAKINLDRINIGYNDAVTGNYVKFVLGHFDTDIKDFDMDKMKFSIPKITLSNVYAKVKQTPAGSSTNPNTTPDTTTKPMNLDLKLGTIDVSKIKVDYETPEMAANVDLGKFLVEINKIDFKGQKVDIKNISLDNTNAALSLAAPKTVQKAVVKTVKKLDTLVAAPKSQAGWAANLGKLTLTNDNIQFDNKAQKPVAKGLDYGHMNIKDLNVDIESLDYRPDSTSGKINNISFKDKSGLALNKFHTDFFYGPTRSFAKNLYIETPNSVLQKDVVVGYPSIDAISKDIGKLSVNANLDGTRIGLKDILLIMPTMASMEPFKSSPGAVFLIDGKVSGRVNDLKIPELDIRGLSDTRIKASASLKGLPDMNKAYFDVNLVDLNISRRDINKLVSPGMLPSNVTIPERLNLKGTFKGSMKAFNTNMHLRSSLGAADVVAKMDMARKGHETYTANVNANNLNVGALIQQPKNVGMITMKATVSGTGLDPKHISLKFDADVESAYVKGYTYQHLVAKGTATNGSYVANVHMKDPNINFSLDAKANMNKKYPSVFATLNVDSINLQKLGFSADPMRFHGKIVADVPTADPDYLNANIKATDLIVVQKAQRIQIDSVSLISTANADSSSLYLKTPFIQAHLGGKYKLTQIGDAVQDVINKYYDMSLASGGTPKAKTTVAAKKSGKAAKYIPAAYSPQQFTFDVHVVKTPLLTQFAPQLTQMEPINLNGHFNSTTGELVVNGAMPKVVYGTNTINNVKLNINTGNNALNYSFNVDEIKVGSSLDLLYTSISGNAQNNKLNISLQVRDAAKKERYRIAGVFSVMPNEYQFSFLQNGLLLDYTPWAVNADNSLQFGNKGIMAKDFTLTSNNQVLSINSDQQVPNAPITVGFKNFKIETLTRMAQQDSLQVGGTINGDAHVSNFQKSPVFTAALNVGDFSFKGDTVGNIAIKVNNQTANAYAASVDITGKGNQVTLDGTYYTSPESRFDMNLNIVNLNMKSVEGFSFGALRNSSGNITGQLKISGTTTAPQVRGDVHFNKAAFNVAMLNSYFTLPNESITFNDQGINFNNFTLVDSTGNKATIAGAIYTKTYTDFRFGLDINMNNFRVINSTQADNKLYYGKLYMDANVKVRGNMDKPVVDANLTVNDKTDLTIVLPTQDPSLQDREGVVEVINENAPKADSILLAHQLDSLKKSGLKGMDVSANINIAKTAKFTIVVDERNGDVVYIQGEAHLNGGIDPSGKTNLTGTYTVASGSYNLAYGPVKRKFNFKPGSTITWTGDPTLADINLTATYIANVPPIDLVSQQLGGDASTLTMYKQKLPFNVNLNLRNQLMKPDISFDIVLPDSTYTVSPDVVQTVNTRLAQIRQDPNEINKQVLGVLVLGHFIGDNPLQSQGGSEGVAGAIRSSVSSLLSDQLNKLAGNLIGGVQLSFDLTSGADYSTGTQQNRTDLNVGLSKSFLNDRITVTVGNNFNLEGQNQPGQKTTDIAGNVSVNYRLTQDGRYMVRAYRRDEFIVVEGQVVETGIGFTITYEYNRFKELFKRRTKQQKDLQKKYDDKQKEQKKEQKDADKEHDKKVADQPAPQPGTQPTQPSGGDDVDSDVVEQLPPTSAKADDQQQVNQLDDQQPLLN